MWLIDHLVTFGKAEELLQGLEADSSLLKRLAELMELDGAALCRLRRLVVPAESAQTVVLSWSGCKRPRNTPRWQGGALLAEEAASCAGTICQQARCSAS